MGTREMLWGDTSSSCQQSITIILKALKSIRSDCRSAPHLTGKRYMLSFFMLAQCFLVRRKIFPLQIFHSLRLAEWPKQHHRAAFKSTESESWLQLWGTCIFEPQISPQQARRESCTYTREKHHVSGTETRRFLNMYWDKRHFHRHKRGTAFD